MKFFCCDLRRLEMLKLAGSANAIEFLEVRDHLEPDPALRQRTLFVRLLRPGFVLSPDNVLIVCAGGPGLAQSNLIMPHLAAPTHERVVRP